jgi:hypothetical protein
VWDQGNSFPSAIVDKIKEGEMTAYEGALASTLGGPDAKTGSEGHTARRVNIVTPFNRIVDDTVDACAITDRFFPKFADLEHNDRNNVFTLLISYAANRICRKLKIDPKNVKLFHDELAALVSLNESSTRTVIKAQFNAQSKHRDIPVTPSAPNIPFTAKLVNVVPIKRLLKKVGTPPLPQLCFTNTSSPLSLSPGPGRRRVRLHHQGHHLDTQGRVRHVQGVCVHPLRSRVCRQAPRAHHEDPDLRRRHGQQRRARQHHHRPVLGEPTGPAQLVPHHGALRRHGYKGRPHAQEGGVPHGRRRPRCRVTFQYTNYTRRFRAG